MEKLCLLLAFSLVWMVSKPVTPAPADGPVDITTPVIISDPIPPLKEFEKLLEKDSVRKWITVEINGTLSYEKGLDPSIPRILEYEEWIGYSISVGDKWYALDFGANKKLAEKAKKLLGKRVVVKGTVEDRSLGIIPRTFKVVVVSELAEAAPVKEWITMQVTGKLEARALPGPYKENGRGPDYLLVVLVNDKQFLLEFDDATDLYAQALKLDGKRVVVSGRFDQTKDSPAIQTHDTKVAADKAKDAIVVNVQGKLIRDAAKERIAERGNVDRGYLTGWKMRVNGSEFPVDFGDNKRLLDLAAKLDGQAVLLTGSLETVDYVPLDWKPWPRPKEKDPMVMEPCYILAPPLRRAQVLRATDLKPVEKDDVQETIHLEIAGDLESIILMGPPPGEGWMVKTGAQTFHLQFSPDLPKEKPAQLNGKKVIVTGTRLDDLTILVTALRLATDR